MKTLVLEDYRQYLDRFWRSHRMTMENHQTGKSTLLTFSEFRFGIGLTETDFTAARLKQIR